MSRRTGSALLAAFLCALPAARAAEEVELSARTDADELALDRTLNLQITATLSSKGEGGELRLPELKDFDVVNRSQSEEVSLSYSNGAASFRRTTVTNVALTPRRVGMATIEAAHFIYRGHVYTTQPISVKVLPLGAGQPRRPSPRAPDAAPDDLFGGQADPFRAPADQDLLLRADVEPKRPFVGEQVTYSLRLFARVPVSVVDKLQLPKLDGFWSEDIESPQQLVDEERTLGGVPYHSFLLRKRALFPLRPGKVEIEPAQVEVSTGAGVLFSRSSAKRASQAMTLEVQPLPLGSPAGFDPGNVGSWTLSASAEPLAASVGQPVTFKLVASGSGNVRELQLPGLGAVDGLRAYNATTADKESVEQGHLLGTRTVEQLLVPERTGEIEIPALTMEIFDPAQKAYRTLRTQPIRLQVSAANGAAAQAAQAPTQNLLAASGVRPIRLRLTEVSAAPPLFSRPWFWPLLLVSPLAVLLLFAAQRTSRLFARDPKERRIRGARSAARARLRGAEALLGAGGGEAASELYAEVSRALTGYLADRQGIVASGLTRDELSRALAERGHSPSTVNALLAALDECDQARFSPTAGGRRAQEQMLARADHLLAALDKARKEAA